MNHWHFIFIILLSSCQNTANKNQDKLAQHQSPTMQPEQIRQFTLQNKHGLSIQVINYGGIVTSIKTPDKNGQFADVTFGFADLELYKEEHPYFGAFIGRYGNRIAKGTFKIDEHTYTIPTNNGENTLHGGDIGFDKRFWAVKEFANATESGLLLTGRSDHMDQGYPGNLDVELSYSLNDDNEFHIAYRATTDQPTVVNLTNHAYFNLSGEGKGDILDHELTLHADRFTPVDKSLIPTGELRPVEGTPFDFRTPRKIGERIDMTDNEQINFGGGYDHNYALNNTTGTLSLAAKVLDPESGRVLEVHTTEPGVQFYTGNFLDGTIIGKSSKPYLKRSGFCLETQHFPNSPNQPDFPSTLLLPGEEYTSKTVYKFSVKKEK